MIQKKRVKHPVGKILPGANWQLAIGNCLLPIALLLIRIFITSCKVGKEYKRPSLEVPDQFNLVVFVSIREIRGKGFDLKGVSAT